MSYVLTFIGGMSTGIVLVFAFAIWYDRHFPPSSES